MRIDEILQEAPLPDDWDASLFDPKTPFKTRVDYARRMAKRIGRGSSRIAFEIPYEGRKTVLKVAMNRKGMAQNAVEIGLFSDRHWSRTGIFIPMIDHAELSDDKDDATWIHAEYADKIKEHQFVAETGLRPDILLSCLRYECNGGNLNRLYHSLYAGEINRESGVVKALRDMIANDLNVDDYTALRNWGMYRGKPVIVDAGFDDEVHAKYYKK